LLIGHRLRSFFCTPSQVREVYAVLGVGSPIPPQKEQDGESRIQPGLDQPAHGHDKFVSDIHVGAIAVRIDTAPFVPLPRLPIFSIPP